MALADLLDDKPVKSQRLMELDAQVQSLQRSVDQFSDMIQRQSSQAPLAPVQGLGQTGQPIQIYGKRSDGPDGQPDKWEGLKLGPNGLLQITTALDGNTQAILESLRDALTGQLSQLVGATINPTGGFTKVDYTADTTIDNADAVEGIWHTNTGASADITLTIPNDLPVGSVLKFKVVEPYRIILQAEDVGSGSDIFKNLSEESIEAGTLSNPTVEEGAVAIIRRFTVGILDANEGMRGTWEMDA